MGDGRMGDGRMGDGRMGDGWTDGLAKSKKIMYFKHFSKTIRYFFLVVSRPLITVFKTFFEKNSKKNKKFILSKKFHTIFFSAISRFFEVCRSGDFGQFFRGL